MDDLIQHPSQSSSQNFGKQFVIAAKKRDRAPVLNISKVPFFRKKGDNRSPATQRQPALCQAGTEYLKQILSQLQPKSLIEVNWRPSTPGALPDSMLCRALKSSPRVNTPERSTLSSSETLGKLSKKTLSTQRPESSSLLYRF